MLTCWKKEDLPENRVKPIPVQFIQRIATVTAYLPPDAHALRAVADMIIFAYFFRLRHWEREWRDEEEKHETQIKFETRNNPQ